MLSAEEVLEGATRDGSLDLKEWPRVLDTILSRLSHIVYNDFPKPTTPPPVSTDSLPPSALPTRPSTQPESSQESQSADKENAPPSSTPPARPPVPSFSQATSQPEADTQSQIPQELQEVYTSITSALTKNFAQHPPYTIQRLAELVLRPKAHYRFLPSYLRAVDRVVSVSSSSAIFPLPQAAVVGNSGPLSNGTATANNSLGSDESLGGALLTPIPWLRSDHERSSSSNGANSQSELVSESTEMVDGPNGAGRIETVSVVNGVLGTSSPRATSPTSSANTSTSTSNNPTPNPAPTPTPTTNTSETLREAGAVTQGELLRQEQQAGVVPVAQAGGPRRSLLTSGANHGDSTNPTPNAPSNVSADEDRKDEPPEEHPHARGPEEIGMEDMGPQERALGGSINIEAAVGRAAPSRGAEEGKGEGQGEGESKGEGEGEGKKEEGNEVEMENAGPTAGKDESMGEDKDKDVVVADPDGKTEEDEKMGEASGDGSGPDAVDTTGR